MLPPPGQIGIRDLQEEKCQEKENGRKQVLASMVPSPGADMNWITVALEERSKQPAVTTMMQQVHNQYQANLSTKSAKANTTNASKNRKAKPKKANENGTSQPGKAVLQDTTNTPQVANETLGEVKSFAKAMAAYYSRPNKFMEGTCCLDCRLAVPNMERNALGRRAVVYYCNEGIKGFDAPDDDPMKSELTCDLILFPKCEAKRRIEYNKVNSERQSGGVRRSRRQTGV
jgi:hypothetical protein